MPFYEYLFGAVMIVASIAIVILILLQQSRNSGLSGAIAGGSDNFFGKNKNSSTDAKLSRITKILCVVFFIITLFATFFFAFMKGKFGI
ncbi:MAG: preprotein translocase subunit SecG [Clostridia bacterium]|nr:preprotein translocase subunit SecG [Clostridia bacterium]